MLLCYVNNKILDISPEQKKEMCSVLTRYPGNSQSVLLTPVSSHPMANGLSHLPVKRTRSFINAEKQGVWAVFTPDLQFKQTPRRNLLI